jgi:hypothetical protein
VGVRHQWSGFEEYLRELGSIPEALRSEASRIVHAHTEAARAELVAVYERHRRTGKLRSKVSTDYPSSSVISGILKSTAPHGALFEWGTAERKNDKGKSLGRMPAAKQFVPIMVAHRARMYAELGELLRSHGFEVSGE